MEPKPSRDDTVDADVPLLSSLLPPSSQWSCLISLKVLSLQVRLALEKCCHDLQVLHYDNTKLAFHCHICFSANATASEKSKPKLARRSSVLGEGGVGLEKKSCITDGISHIASPLRVKPMASLMSDYMSDYTREVVLLDEDLIEPQEKSEEPVSPPRTAFMPITKPIPLRPPPSSSSLSNAAGGTFNPSSHHSSFQPLSTLQSPLFSNPHFKSQVPQFLGPAPHTSQISSPGFPPC